MVLVDTSVWVDHFRRGNERLVELLEGGNVVCHPFVVGELACGNLSNRVEILGDITQLPEVTRASHAEVLEMLDRLRLYGRGLGWVDALLLASALLSGVTLWTLDRRLRTAATHLDVAL